MYPIWRGQIKDNKLKLYDKDAFNAYLSVMNGQEIDLVVRKTQKYRSYQQNKYYWGVVVELLSEATGYERQEMHEVLKGKFLARYVTIAGSEVPIVRSTTELNTVEFEKYTAEIRRWATQELDCQIPEPQEIDV